MGANPMKVSALTQMQFLIPSDSLNYSNPDYLAAVEHFIAGEPGAAATRLEHLDSHFDSQYEAHEVCEVRRLRILALLNAGQVDLAELLAQEFVARSRQGNDPRWLGVAKGLLAFVNAHMGHAIHAIDLLRDAKVLLANAGANGDLAWTCTQLGYCLLQEGRIETAQAELETASNLASLCSDSFLEANASKVLGFCYLKLGNLRRANQLYERAEDLFGAVGARQRVAQTLYSRAALALHSGEPHRARLLIERGLALYDGSPEVLEKYRWDLLHSWCLIESGRAQEARLELEALCQVLLGINAQRDLALCHEFLGDAYGMLGEDETAVWHYGQGIQIGRRVAPQSDVVIECHRKCGELLASTGALAEAARFARIASRLARVSGEGIERACVLRLRGQLLVRRGRQGPGGALLQRALVRLEAMGARREAARASKLLESVSRGALDEESPERGDRPSLSRLKESPFGRLSPDDAGVLTIAGERRPVMEEAAKQGIVTTDARVLRAFQSAKRAAKTHLPVLIHGETGTGKELLAEVVHGSSGLSGSFFGVNCAALPPDLLDAELFGHARGAYTGAHRDRPGLIEAADGGTLFLDEIGEMTLAVQGRVLRAIELGEIRRLGENKVRRVDTRFVAATHRNLKEMVQEGTFRADLYFRLRGVVIHLPPLRERPGDVDLLTDYFLNQSCRTYRKRVELSEDARESLRRHPWPGNVRELKTVIERAVSMHDDGYVLSEEDLVLDDVRIARSLEEHLEEEERRRVIAILESVGWNRTRAARVLRLKRTTLLGKMKRLGIVPPVKS